MFLTKPNGIKVFTHFIFNNSVKRVVFKHSSALLGDLSAVTLLPEHKLHKVKLVTVES